MIGHESLRKCTHENLLARDREEVSHAESATAAIAEICERAGVFQPRIIFSHCPWWPDGRYAWKAWVEEHTFSPGKQTRTHVGPEGEGQSCVCAIFDLLNAWRHW